LRLFDVCPGQCTDSTLLLGICLDILFVNNYLLFLQVVAFVLIGVAVYGRASALVTNLPIIGGILACGVILFLISILGLIGAVKHHQVLLFFVSFFMYSWYQFVKFA
jgi:hypothetical protein